jgi:hypothetical protein
MNDLLHRIQRLQFTDRSGAESLLLPFIRETFQQLDVMTVELRPLAISLNSFNGFLKLANGERLFFKTHVETDTVIDEYYNASMLAAAGYPVIQPLYSSTRSGQQLLIYEVVEDPSVFDLARHLEQNGDNFDDLTRAQNIADDDLFQIYLKTLDTQSARDHAKAPIHQLFYHRLTGGRLDRFYGDNRQMTLPGKTYSLTDVRKVRWTINHSTYNETLDDIIHRAIRLLYPEQQSPSIIGHGDAHNGNVFFKDHRELLYFDPAFAGRHHPLLDMAKPLFHNVFAMWMYFPQEENQKLTISLKCEGNHWIVEHNYDLDPVREMFLFSKVERVVKPITRHLKQHHQLRSDWRAFLKAALFCCPFLTLDLTGFPPEISLLGLLMAVQMGSESAGVRSRIDCVLDDVERAL